MSVCKDCVYLLPKDEIFLCQECETPRCYACLSKMDKLPKEDEISVLIGEEVNSFNIKIARTEDRGIYWSKYCCTKDIVNRPGVKQRDGFNRDIFSKFNYKDFDLQSEFLPTGSLIGIELKFNKRSDPRYIFLKDAESNDRICEFKNCSKVRKYRIGLYGPDGRFPSLFITKPIKIDIFLEKKTPHVGITAVYKEIVDCNESFDSHFESKIVFKTIATLKMS